MLFRREYIYLIVAAIAAINAFLFFPSYYLHRIASDNDQLKNPLHDSGIFEEVFQHPDVFLHNYVRMEEVFKIFVYPNKDEDISHYNQRSIGGLFSSEMFFHYSLLASYRFLTRDDLVANLFFIPLTRLQILGKGVYANSENYLRYLINKYPHWNQSKGVDHFFVTCNERGASLSERVPLNNSITVSCSTHYHSRHGIHHKHHHITLPQILLPFASPVGGNDIHHRKTLAFWACPSTAQENHPDREKSKTSKYCICDGARFIRRICITDSIHYGCVPGKKAPLKVILSDNYELPFNYILDWTKFSVIINKNSAHRVEQILGAIPDSKFSDLHYNTVKVQRHFEWNSPSKRYDAFHMIMYELWLRHLSLSEATYYS